MKHNSAELFPQITKNCSAIYPQIPRNICEEFLGTSVREFSGRDSKGLKIPYNKILTSFNVSNNSIWTFSSFISIKIPFLQKSILSFRWDMGFLGH